MSQAYLRRPKCSRERARNFAVVESTSRPTYEVIRTCRACGAGGLRQILNLGETPIENALLSESQLTDDEPRFPLTVAFCPSCTLVQTQESLDGEVLFGRDYPYYSSFSEELLAHSRANAESLIESRGLGPDSLVVELASNDGYLLKNFVNRGVPVLGIDPAAGPAIAAERQGVTTLRLFFGRQLGQGLRDDGRTADVVIANNVLAHVPDLNSFVAGIRLLLKPNGVAVIEVPYLVDLIERCEFDTIYHEHFCYYSVTALSALFERHGLSLNHLEHYPIHGGSLRLFVERQASVSQVVQDHLADERRRGLTGIEFYRSFASRVEQIKAELTALLHGLKADGASIAAYGAAAKGATLLNYTEIGAETIDFVVDRNVHKQGLYMPGVRIPIVPPERLVTDRPDYTLLLAWNFTDEIVRQQEAYTRLGGRFIRPIPSPAVL
jgi:SAM-dependent methyltransferase